MADGLLSANLPTAGGTVALALTSGTDVHGPLLSVQVNPLLANGATGFVAAGLRLTLDATTAYRAQWSRQWSSDFAQVRQGQVVLEKVTTSGGVSTVTVLAMSLLQTETTVSPVTISVMRGADGLLTVTAANATVGTITLEATVASSPDDVAPSAVSLEVTASGNSAANTTYDHISWTTSPSRTVRRNDYDGLDRLMAHAEVNDVGVTTAGTTYGRDALGRLINRTAAGGSVIASYAYDALDRQQSITEGGITTISAYIGTEWMRRSTTPSVGAPTTWTYDDQGITSRVSGTNTTTYQRHGGSLLWENGTTNGASSTNSYALDLHGNVTGIAGTITNGQLTMDAYRQRFDYDAWGQIVRERYGQVDQNNQPNYYPVSTISSGPRYRGMWYDGGAKGVYKTETRLYDPELGQFLQEDPARAGGNWFAYCDGDPVNRHDPTGLDWVWNFSGVMADGGEWVWDDKWEGRDGVKLTDAPDIAQRKPPAALSGFGRIGADWFIEQGLGQFLGNSDQELRQVRLRAQAEIAEEKAAGSAWTGPAIRPASPGYVNPDPAWVQSLDQFQNKGSRAAVVIQSGLAAVVLAPVAAAAWAESSLYARAFVKNPWLMTTAAGTGVGVIATRNGPAIVDTFADTGRFSLGTRNHVRSGSTPLFSLPSRAAGTVEEATSSGEMYLGVQQASAYLKSMSVPRAKRVTILQSFDILTIKVRVADDATFGIRFHDFGKTAKPSGQFLNDTFSSLTNRETLALPWVWNEMSGVVSWKIKPGTTYLTGKIGAQLSYGPQYVGGAVQHFVLEPWKYGTLLKP